MKFAAGFILVFIVLFSCNTPPGRQRAVNYCPFDKLHWDCATDISRSTIVDEAEKFACAHFTYMDDTIMWVHSYYSYQQKSDDQSCVFWMDNGKGMVTCFDNVHPKGETKPAEWLSLVSPGNDPPDMKDTVIWPAKTVFNCRHVSIKLYRYGYQLCLGGCPETPEYGMRSQDLEMLRKIDGFCRPLK